MAIRDDFFRQFGPLQIEAIVDYLLDAVNTLRQEQGHPAITKNEYLESLSNHITDLQPYDWMV